MPVGNETLTAMDGTTLCPHCNTRFKIAAAQLEAHHGMVRCGHCLQAFDARSSYIPNHPPAAAAVETAAVGETGLIESIPPADEAGGEAGPLKALREDLLDLEQPRADEPAGLTLAEQVAIVQDEDEDDRPSPPTYSKWPWAVAASLLLLVLFAQATYFFRVDLAARLPRLKPALTGYCQLLGCSVPLPQRTDLMSIESSDLEADPAHENQINLNALLRNRASYPQAFPDLELTLNDTQDKPLARRIFKPKDYLPPQESAAVGLPPNHELVVKLHLNTADLRPTGYRLVLFYPRQ